MRSPIEPGVREWIARAVLLAAIVTLLWRSWSPSAAATEQSATSAGLPAALETWTTGPPPAAVMVRLSEVPNALERDWLAALRRAGAVVSWAGELQGLAVEALASAEPQHSYVIRATGAQGAELAFHDRDRELASVQSADGGASIRTSMLHGPVRASTPDGHALAALPAAPRVGRVAVTGPAGWETKFVTAALEERGWRVDSRVTVAPGVDVGSLSAGALDTSRYSAAVVVDVAPAAWMPDLMRFVRSGGGLVVTGAAARSGAIAALLPARAGSAFAATDTVAADRSTLGGSSLLSGPRAVVLEAREGTPVVSGGRFGAGRVIVSGYGDTWHWRMTGDDRALEEHRDWWSALVGAAAYAADTAEAVISPESAPLAVLHAALGPPAAAPRPSLSVRGFPVEAVLFGVAVLALLGEVVSRRRRGLP